MNLLKVSLISYFLPFWDVYTAVTAVTTALEDTPALAWNLVKWKCQQTATATWNLI